VARGVKAVTDEESNAAAREAEQATQAVEAIDFAAPVADYAPSIVTVCKFRTPARTYEACPAVLSAISPPVLRV
jgi:hypothetical protein